MSVRLSLCLPFSHCPLSFVLSSLYCLQPPPGQYSIGHFIDPESSLPLNYSCGAVSPTGLTMPAATTNAPVVTEIAPMVTKMVSVVTKMVPVVTKMVSVVTKMVPVVTKMLPVESKLEPEVTMIVWVIKSMD
ncbi:hypothetical protein XENTR_v10015663 [Xenopus tropicalis]|nr:hypothetical protein XENTR_v10015663 [Xenopus tropicalis]